MMHHKTKLFGQSETLRPFGSEDPLTELMQEMPLTLSQSPEKNLVHFGMEDPIGLPSSRETLFLPQGGFHEESQSPEETFHVEKSNAQSKQRNLPSLNRFLANTPSKPKILRKTEYGYGKKSQFLQAHEPMRPSLKAKEARDAPFKNLFRSNAIELSPIPALDNQVKDKFVAKVKKSMASLKNKVMTKMEHKA
jgi:hypothetical protein